jgi:hypothetical protein
MKSLALRTLTLIPILILLCFNVAFAQRHSAFQLAYILSTQSQFAAISGCGNSLILSNLRTAHATVACFTFTPTTGVPVQEAGKFLENQVSHWTDLTWTEVGWSEYQNLGLSPYYAREFNYYRHGEWGFLIGTEVGRAMVYVISF